MAGGEQVVEQRRVEENVTIQDHEALIQQRSCHPERIHAVGLCVPGVLNIGNPVPTGARARDRPGSRRPPRCRRCPRARSARIWRSTSVTPPDLDQALRRFAGRAVQPRALARRQDDSSHRVPPNRFAAHAADRARRRPEQLHRLATCTARGRAARSRWRRTAPGRRCRRPPPAALQPEACRMRSVACSASPAPTTNAGQSGRQHRLRDALAERQADSAARGGIEDEDRGERRSGSACRSRRRPARTA